MTGWKASAVLLAVVAGASGLAGGYWIARRMPLAEPAQAPPPAAQDDRKILYWYDPMVPNQRFDKPGKSPFMDMQLVAKYARDAGEAGEEGSVRIAPGTLQNLGMRLATAERTDLSQRVFVTGTIAFNDRDVAVLQARTGGFVERVYRRASGDVVEKGAALADILQPDWAAAQIEFLALRDIADRSLLDAARQRLRLLGMRQSEIDRVERSGKTAATTTVVAPVTGVIQSLEVREGMTVAPGMTLARLNGLDPVWLEAAVPEALSGSVRAGAPVEARLVAFPEEAFAGTIVAVLPEADAVSRTVKLRIELSNHDRRLRPGMFADIRLGGDAMPALTVPAEAVIRTGRRAIVMLAEPEGRFRPVEVMLGREGGGRIAVLSGLAEGQKVVASGQFLIDSEASLAGLTARLDSSDVLHRSSGRVEAIDGDEITLSHEPIPAIGWGAMTMSFKLARPDLTAGLRPGDTVAFALRGVGDAFVIEQIGKAGAPK
ncbi:MAG: efflux RND transporter periplasmic adaptor subunit [Alphaproteobacteria bacterium]|jgi:Cu(I)/Ag(I) efflux system membrane fusion protein|nr:efflux RND transporter periplasmic adaptor subunit [Alphaproteobacteria bacterium]